MPGLSNEPASERLLQEEDKAGPTSKHEARYQGHFPMLSNMGKFSYGRAFSNSLPGSIVHLLFTWFLWRTSCLLALMQFRPMPLDDKSPPGFAWSIHYCSVNRRDPRWLQVLEIFG